jgi:hypothetical protein
MRSLYPCALILVIDPSIVEKFDTVPESDHVLPDLTKNA